MNIAEERVKAIKDYRAMLDLKYGKHLIDIHTYKSHVDDLLAYIKQLEDEPKKWARKQRKEVHRMERRSHRRIVL